MIHFYKYIVSTLLLFIFCTSLKSQERSFGIITAPSLTQKTTDNLLQNSSLLAYSIRNTPSGEMSFSSSFSHQTGLAYRISSQKWHLQGSLLYTQNRIGITIQNRSRFTPVIINTINPEISLIKRIHLSNKIELNWQLGINAGFTLFQNRALAKEGGYSYGTPDTSTYFWAMSFNATSSKPRLSLVSSFNLSIPFSDKFNVELGFGILSEINRPNQWSYSQKTTHNNQPLGNSDFIRNTESFNERMIFIKLAVFKNLGLVSKSKKRT